MTAIVFMGLWLTSGWLSYLVCRYVVSKEVKFSNGVFVLYVAMGPFGLLLTYWLGILFHKMGLYD